MKIYEARLLSVPTVKHVSSAVQWDVKLACVRPRKLVYMTEKDKKKKDLRGPSSTAKTAEKCVQRGGVVT